MKNYKDIADSVFERKEQYENEKRQKRKMLTRTITPVCCVCLAALLGFGALQGGMISQAPIQSAEDAIVPGTKDPYVPVESKPQSSKSDDHANDSVQSQKTGVPGYMSPDDMLGRVIYNNETYIQILTISADDIELDEKIGNGSDFEGYYKNFDMGCEIYTVKNNADLLVAKLDNGANIVLKRTIE